MLFVLRYFFVICFFGLGLFFFNIYVNIHVYSQIFYNLIYKNFEEPLGNYDYIIVGSGTAGSILAFRLSQEKKNKILLLEAGTYSNFLFDVPVLTPLLQKSNLDWQYETVPQKFACRAMTNNVSFWPRGKVFGGTHRFNNMLHTRGHKNDFDDWYKDKLDYNYEKDVLHYFKKSENWLSLNNDNPVHLNNLNCISQLAESVLDAAEILGYPVRNMNSDPGIGFMKPYVTTRNGKRWTTSHSLLEKNFPNLKIITNAHVNKIIFKNNFEASGVEFSYLGENRQTQAKKGIILSAGTIGTPKILLLSGVGPQKHLSEHKIHPRINLPVGENLKDHITTGLDLIILNQTLSINIESLVSPFSGYKYFFFGSGPWTSVGCEVIGFCQSDSMISGDQPDLELLILPAGISSDAGKHLRNVIGIKPEIWTDYFSKLAGKQIISIIPIVLRPKSSGTIRLKSSDPFTPVEINPNYLSDKNDVEVLLGGIEIIKKIIKTEPMQKLGAKLNPNIFPGCENFKFDTTSYWECYVRQLSLTNFHPTGTCKMGNKHDLKTVVDYNFQILGTNKLFVVDASVLPNLPSANPNAAIAMMAERAADEIKYLNFLMVGKCRKINIFLLEKRCVI